MIGLWYISEHVNEYLRLAACADKQQLQRIKTIFEKKNQKSTEFSARLKQILWIFFVASLNQFLPD
jgi:ribulose bisphosphate carboxylase small subunit